MVRILYIAAVVAVFTWPTTAYSEDTVFLDAIASAEATYFLDRYEIVPVKRPWVRKLYLEKDFEAVSKELIHRRNEIDSEYGALRYTDMIRWLGEFSGPDRYPLELAILDEWAASDRENVYPTLIMAYKHLSYWYWVDVRAEIPPIQGHPSATSLDLGQGLLDAAEKLAPDDPEIASLRMSLAIYANEPSTTVQTWYRRTLELEPDHVGVRGNLAEYLWTTGDLPALDEQLRDWLSLSEARPLVAVAGVVPTTLLARERNEEYIDPDSELIRTALSAMERAVGAYPDELRLACIGAWYFQFLERTDRAHQLFEFIGNRLPDDLDLDWMEYHWSRAEHYAAVAGHEDGPGRVEAVRRALAIEPNHPFALFLAGNHCAIEQRFDEAAELLTRSLDSEPAYWPAVKALIGVLIETGETDEALRTAQRADAAFRELMNETEAAELDQVLDSLDSPTE